MKRMFLYTGMFLLAGFVVAAEGVVNVNVKQAKELLRDPKTVLLDVRTPGEYNQEHIKGSILIPITELESRLGELPSGKDRKIVIHCTVGVRSSRAAKMLKEKGYSNVYNLDGGIRAWIAAGEPVVKL